MSTKQGIYKWSYIWTNMAARWKILWIAEKTSLAFDKKKKKATPKLLLDKEYLRDHRCKRKNIIYKCKIFEAVSLTHHGHYTHVDTVSKIIGINTENISAKQGIHMWSLIINNKYSCQMHSIYASYCWGQSLLAYLFYLPIQ